MFVLAFVFVFVFVLIVACVVTHLFLFVHGRLRAGVARERMGKGDQGQQAGVWWCEGREGGEGAVAAGGGPGFADLFVASKLRL